VVGVEHIPKSGAFLIAPTTRAISIRRSSEPGAAADVFLRAQDSVERPRVFVVAHQSRHDSVDRDGGQDVGALKRVLRALGDGKVDDPFSEGTRTLDAICNPRNPASASWRAARRCRRARANFRIVRGVWQKHKVRGSARA